MAVAINNCGNSRTRFVQELPEQITAHLGSCNDSGKTRDRLTKLGCNWGISAKDEPCQTMVRSVVVRTKSWRNRRFKLLAICTVRRSISVLEGAA